MKAICLIGDIVQSRKVRDRHALQLQLRRTIDQLNETKRDYVLSPYTITLGDEFQVVYYRAKELFADVFFILYSLWPVKVRFSLGLGFIDTPVNDRAAIGMDGSAFHAARDGIGTLKASDSLFHVSTLATAEAIRQMNLTLRLISHVCQNWKKSRFLIFRYLLEEMDVKEIASLSSLTGAAVYKNIQAGALLTIGALCKEMEKNINKELSQL